MAVDAFTRLQNRDCSLRFCISPRCPTYGARPRLRRERLRADCRMMFARILACYEEDLAFVVLITTLALEPLVSSNAQSDMGLSPGPLPAQTTSDGNHTIIVVLSIKTRSCIIPLHTSATCGGAHGKRLWW
jgi:hypothetical protein